MFNIYIQTYVQISSRKRLLGTPVNKIMADLIATSIYIPIHLSLYGISKTYVCALKILEDSTFIALGKGLKNLHSLKIKRYFKT